MSCPAPAARSWAAAGNSGGIAGTAGGSSAATGAELPGEQEKGQCSWTAAWTRKPDWEEARLLASAAAGTQRVHVKSKHKTDTNFF